MILKFIYPALKIPPCLFFIPGQTDIVLDMLLITFVTAAHFSRVQNDWFALACLVFPFILLSKKEWVMRIFQVFLLFGGAIWIERTISLVRMRQRIGESWVRLAIILGVVALFTIFSAAVFNNKKINAFRRYLKRRI